MRAKNKDFCPGRWLTSVGGYVLAGETYEQAAHREMKEEVGVDLPIKLFSKDIYYNTRQNLRKFLKIYKAYYDGIFKVEIDKVDRIEFFHLEKVKEMLINDEDKFHPELSFILKKYFY